HLLRFSAACPVVREFRSFLSFFFFNDPATTEIYTLSLHDALPIWRPYLITGLFFRAGLARPRQIEPPRGHWRHRRAGHGHRRELDRKSTRLNSSHSQISYAVFCLKKKKRKRKSMRAGS